ncbi:exodeoxyribonuclease I [Glaciecola petra]|uniref:Exodeoxyribonuclease I n=1 Tax=Glaciecola petra TaxID=3075602 RepID=A0ABU2ZNJ4_9ALTE|nr:exodeoxyribonuclease I [Aestuariibacter sp. P117]MDT0594194.1 exodeoxyribonuclease I [Aestuariibacter sp. P117]
MATSILWHDYETWGVRPSVDFPAQFAAIRTDSDLNIIENSPIINWACKVPHDYLPHPEACIVTGLSPLVINQTGMSEPFFADKIHQQMSQANTCVAGYNSIKFDDEVTRHLFYRNFYPVYDREFKNDNTRWDIIDLVRACYALRPEGINWPLYEDGRPCFKLEQLTAANDITHASAHDALSDVYATIAVAKLIKQKQTRLYEFYWQLRNKHIVNRYLQRYQQTILVYVSGYISAKSGCCTLIMPICPHPKNKNATLCIDLNRPIDAFLANDAETLSQLLFHKSEQVNTEKRPSIYSVAANKCPFVAPLNTLNPQQSEIFKLDIEACKQNFEMLQNASNLVSLCQQVFNVNIEKETNNNVDQGLYTTSFPQPADTNLMKTVRHTEPEQLIALQGKFENEIYNKILFRYRARHFPHLLAMDEIDKWQQHLQFRFSVGKKEECLSLEEYLNSIEELMAQYQQNPKKIGLLNKLKRYAMHVTGIETF